MMVGLPLERTAIHPQSYEEPVMGRQLTRFQTGGAMKDTHLVVLVCKLHKIPLKEQKNCINDTPQADIQRLSSMLHELN